VSPVPRRARAATAPRSRRAYPGHVVERGEPDHRLVTALQRRLGQRGCPVPQIDGSFGPRTQAAVKLFQARFPDPSGAPLVVDGKVGPLTWATLFGPGSVPTVAAARDALLAAALGVAVGEIGVREEPPGSNRGPRVDGYLRAVGLDPTQGSFAWCAAFAYWCFARAAEELGRPNPVIRTAGVLEHWRRAGAAGIRRLPAAEATEDPGRVHPGMLFVLDTGGGTGHTGFVERVEGGRLITVEGNTNDDGSREGVGVFRRTGRKLAAVNRGYIDYARR
jgi:CHAP domain/Putative peptidoglycan binding domain